MSARKKILVADDDCHIRGLLQSILQRAGYDVILAEDGKVAIQKALGERPDLVITDALMPKLHGFLLCKMLKKSEDPPKVIVLTGVYKKASYKREAKEEYGADGLMGKPFDLLELLDLVERQLGDSPGHSPRAGKVRKTNREASEVSA
jgi:DNA-binding response OmpR family regulator